MSPERPIYVVSTYLVMMSRLEFLKNFKFPLQPILSSCDLIHPQQTYKWAESLRDIFSLMIK